MQDFIIIGGGIAGVGAGAHLSELGSVTLLEGEEALGYHASGRSAALYEANYGSPTTIQLNLASRAGHEAMGVLLPRGFMLVGKSDDYDTFAADRTKMKLTDISPEDARQMWPTLGPDIAHVAYNPDCWDIDTDLLLQGFARVLRQNGGTLHTSMRVSTIDRITGGWRVQCGDQVFEGRNLVNAAGAWVDHIAQMAGIAPLGFQPKRRSMARIPQPEGMNLDGAPILFGPGESWYAKPDAGALIVSPADATPVDPHDAWADDMTLAEGLDRFTGYAPMDITRMLANWAGLRTFAPDGSLVLGPSHQDPTFIWCAGQGGYGMQSSHGASQLLADLVAGRTSALDAASVAGLSAARFA